jgi:hypothetical protein
VLKAAELVRLSPRTLEKHRIHGTGPTFKKVCGRVIYASADVLAWVEAGSRIRTGDCGG